MSYDKYATDEFSLFLILFMQCIVPQWSLALTFGHYFTCSLKWKNVRKWLMMLDSHNFIFYFCFVKEKKSQHVWDFYLFLISFKLLLIFISVDLYFIYYKRILFKIYECLQFKICRGDKYLVNILLISLSKYYELQIG